MASPFGERTVKNSETSLHWTRRDLEIISRHMTGQLRPTRRLYTVPRRADDGEAGPVGSRQPLTTAQVAALIVLGFALLACLVGALASMRRNDPSAPRVAARPPAEAGRATTASSASEAGPTATTVLADAPAPSSRAAPTPSEPRELSPITVASDGGEAVVRAFYEALGRGDGEAASALVVAEKRSSRAYSPRAIQRFYGGLREPLRLTAVTPLKSGAFRVGYRYSAGRSRCDGQAVVSLTSRDGRDLVRSIRALNGC